MINPMSYSTCSEFYEVSLSVQFVRTYAGVDRSFRLEALRNPQTGKYSTSAYIRENVTLQPTYPATNGKFGSAPTSYSIWAQFTNIGWTNRDSAEAAIEQAMGFLAGS
jgi:hypothetical protein